MTAGLAEAEDVLLRAVWKQPESAVILYGLACCNAQSGKIRDAKDRIMRAIDLDPAIRLKLLDDLELEPLSMDFWTVA